MLESRSFDGWQRLSRSVLAQAGGDDPEALAQVVEHIAWMQAQLPAVVAKLRAGDPEATGAAAQGYSWSQIAAALGITRQAAQQKYGQRVDA